MADPGRVRRIAGVAVLVALGIATLVAPAAAAQPAEPEWPAAEVRDDIERILARAEFREPPRTFLDRARDWVLRQLDRTIEALVRAGGAGVIGWVVVGLAAVGAVVFAARFARGVQADPARARPVAPAPRRSARDWGADAEAHEAAGRWRPALRCRYRALVAALAERGLVDDVPGRTTGEYRAEVDRAAPRSAAAFDDATALFEAAWYGDHPTGPDESRRFRELSDRVLEAAGR